MSKEPKINVLMLLWSKTHAISKKMDASLGAIHGIGFAEYMALHQLNAAPQSMIRRIDLAHQLHRSASGVTKMLNPMEKIGLVSRESNPRDARVSLVRLTDTGRQTYQQASNTLEQLTAEVFAHLDGADTHTLHGLLDGISC
jgi:DNA-binding MarR family transcriptional regulator